MVDIYLVLVKIVVLTLSSKLKVCCCTFSKPGTNVTSIVVYAERQHSTARHGIMKFSAVLHLHQPVTVYLVECKEGDRLQSLFDGDNDREASSII